MLGSRSFVSFCCLLLGISFPSAVPSFILSCLSTGSYTSQLMRMSHRKWQLESTFRVSKDLGIGKHGLRSSLPRLSQCVLFVPCLGLASICALPSEPQCPGGDVSSFWLFVFPLGNISGSKSYLEDFFTLCPYLFLFLRSNPSSS